MTDDETDRPGRRSGAFGRLVGSFVSPIVDNVDVDEIVEQVDVDELIRRVDVNNVVERIDVEAVVARIDPDELLDRVDPNRLLDRVDPDRLLDRVDPDRLLDRVDPDRLLDRVDPDRLLDRVDPNRLLDRVDPDRLLDRVDPDRLLDRVDPDRLLDRVDPDRLLDRVDPNRLLDRVDVNELVVRTHIDEIIARSTTGVFGQLLDVARTQIVVADQLAQGVAARLLRGTARELPPAPGGRPERFETPPASAAERAVAMQGRFAGSVSRFLAFLLDQFVIGLIFTVGAVLVQSAVRVVFQSEFDVEDGGVVVVAAYGLWAFVYLAGSLAATGRTIGKAIMGLLVVRSDGTKLDGRRASLRTVAFPLGFLLLGVGFLIGLVRADRRQLHDLIADTGVVYSWDADTAQLRADS